MPLLHQDQEPGAGADQKHDRLRNSAQEKIKVFNLHLRQTNFVYRKN